MRSDFLTCHFQNGKKTHPIKNCIKEKTVSRFFRLGFGLFCYNFLLFIDGKSISEEEIVSIRTSILCKDTIIVCSNIKLIKTHIFINTLCFSVIAQIICFCVDGNFCRREALLAVANFSTYGFDCRITGRDFSVAGPTTAFLDSFDGGTIRNRIILNHIFCNIEVDCGRCLRGCETHKKTYS